MFEAGSIIFRIQSMGAEVLGRDLNAIDGAAKGTKRSLDENAKSTDQLGRKQDETAKKSRGLGNDLTHLSEKGKQAATQLGRSLLGVGASLIAITGLSVKAAIDWESAWTGVTKTVDGTPKQLDAVQDGLRGLARELPSTHEEIAAVAEAAGQLGVQTDNIVSFTKTMIDLGQTTNLSSDEAATALARFMNVMGTAQSKTSNLGSAVVELGNNYATTEAEIVAMAQRLSGAGKQVGLTEGEVLGLATALSSVGIEAEAGGSAVSKVIIDIAASVDKGGDRLDQFAKIAGVSADLFAKKWKTDPGAALALFVKGLANAEQQGESTLGMLDELGISEVRMRDALLRSAAASDQFTKAMDTGNKAFDENNALLAEAEKRYGTTASKIEIAKNNIVDASIGFGEVFLPVLVQVSGAVSDLAQFVGDLPEPVKGGIAVLSVFAGTAALASGALLLLVPKIVEFRAATRTLAAELPNATRAGKSFLGMLGGPWGAGVTAATILLGQLVQQQMEFDGRVRDITSTLDEQTAAITDNTKAQLAQKLAGDGVFDAAKKMGISSKDLTDAILGNEDALERVNEKMHEYVGNNPTYLTESFTGALFAQEPALNKVAGALGREREALAKSKDQKKAQIAATDDLKGSTDKNTESTKKAADAYLDANGQAESLANTLQKLLDKVNEANDKGQDAVSTNARYQQALADVAETIDKAKAGAEGYSRSLDESTAAGSKNAQMFSDLAADSIDAAKAQLELDGNTDAYYQRLQAGRQTLYDQILALTGNADAAQALTDKVYAMPTEHEIKIIAETAAASKMIDDFVSRYQGKRITMEMFLESSGGDRAAAASAARYTGQALNYLNQADGAFYPTAGRPVQHFALGGFSEDHRAQIARAGAIRVWAEPETGGEAYIPFAPSKRKQSLAIWEETGRQLGAGQSVSAEVNVYPTPGMSEETIGRIAASELNSMLRGLG